MFDLILYVPVNNFTVMLGRVFLGRTSSKQGLIYLAQGHNSDAGEAQSCNPCLNVLINNIM